MHTLKHFLPKLNTNQPAAKRPQLSHFENLQAWMQQEQEAKVEEEEEDKDIDIEEDVVEEAVHGTLFPMT